MTTSDAFEQIINSFVRYYNIKKEDVEPPFAAEAEFHAHGEQYLLVKAAHISDIDSNEYVFFATEEDLTTEKLLELDKTAWERGLSRIKPYYGHRNSDITLIVLAENVREDIFQVAKKLKHYKSYLFSIYGWSHYKLAVCDCSTGTCGYNRMGKDLKKITKSLFSEKTGKKL